MLKSSQLWQLWPLMTVEGLLRNEPALDSNAGRAHVHPLDGWRLHFRSGSVSQSSARKWREKRHGAKRATLFGCWEQISRCLKIWYPQRTMFNGEKMGKWWPILFWPSLFSDQPNYFLLRFTRLLDGCTYIKWMINLVFSGQWWQLKHGGKWLSEPSNGESVSCWHGVACRM